MKKPSTGQLKKVTPENLASLGAERLAQILTEVADTRADLKRRLRMELAAGLGAVHVVPEIDKRLSAFETSRGQVTWRQEPAFVRDLDAVRGLIGRLGLDEADAATERLWRFLATEPRITGRMREPKAAVEAIYRQAAIDLGRLLAPRDPRLIAHALVDAAATRPAAWSRWLPDVLAALARPTAALALALARGKAVTAPGWIVAVRALADAAGDIEAFAATFSEAARKTPVVATQIAERYVASGEVEAAGAALRLAAPKPAGLLGRLPAPDFDWEGAWIDYLQRSGDRDAAQAVRWASFQRTLDIGRAKAFVGQLSGFDDVAAEEQVFAEAAHHRDFAHGLELLMSWPALAEAGRMILDRPGDIAVAPEQAELWAGKLRRRFPAAAHLLLRRAAAAAFKRREFKMSERLTQEADTIVLPM